MPSPIPTTHVAGVSISSKKAPLVLLILVVVLALFGRATTSQYVAAPAPALAPPASPATPKEKPKVITGPVAYFCNSGYAVKYHADSNCPGLEHCSSSVDKIALSTAKARMEPCRVCH
jgi:hypothetical protein